MADDIVLVDTLKLPKSTPMPSVPRESGKGRVLYLDILRVIAAISVIYIHTSADLKYDMRLIHLSNWWLALFIDSSNRWCVPIYVMLSGALVLTYRRRYSTSQFLQKRLLRVVIPFVAWSAIYVFWHGEIVHQVNITSWVDIWNHTVGHPAEYHLWFFYMIIGLYVATPALSVLIEHANRTLLWAAVGICFIGSALSLLQVLTGLNNDFVGSFPFGPDATYVGYFILGYLLVSGRPATIWAQTLVYIGAILGIVLTMYTTYRASVITPIAKGSALMFNEPLAAYTSLTTLLLAVAIFMICRAVAWERILRWTHLRSLLNSLALSTFGIYLVHVIVKYYIQMQTQAWVPFWSMRYQLVAAPVIFIISAVIIVAMRRTPLLKQLVP